MKSGSITHWIKQIKEGDESVAEQGLWDRHFSRLADLARTKLNDLPPHLRDDEDLTLSALNTFFTRAKQDCFSQLHDRTDLWQLLARITVRKSVDRQRNAHAQKRGAGLAHDGFGFQVNLSDVATNEPTPDMLAAVNEECQLLMGALDEELRPVARMKLEGYTNAEIAETLGRVERTIERSTVRDRSKWL